MQSIGARLGRYFNILVGETPHINASMRPVPLEFDHVPMYGTHWTRPIEPIAFARETTVRKRRALRVPPVRAPSIEPTLS